MHQPPLRDPPGDRSERRVRDQRAGQRPAAPRPDLRRRGRHLRRQQVRPGRLDGAGHRRARSGDVSGLVRLPRGRERVGGDAFHLHRQGGGAHARARPRSAGLRRGRLRPDRAAVQLGGLRRLRPARAVTRIARRRKHKTAGGGYQGGDRHSVRSNRGACARAPGRRAGAGRSPAGAQVGGRSARHAGRSLPLRDVAADLSRRAQIQPGRRQVAGIRGGVPRLRAPARGGDERRPAGGAARGQAPDPPLGQAQVGARERRGHDAAGRAEQGHGRLPRRLAARGSGRAVGRSGQALHPARRQLRAVLSAHGRQGHVHPDRGRDQGAEPLGCVRGRPEVQRRSDPGAGRVQRLAPRHLPSLLPAVHDSRRLGRLRPSRVTGASPR